MRNIRLAALTAFGALALASCGSAQVNNDTLVIGMEAGYQPFNWTTTVESEHTLPIDGASGEYADGYDVQIAKYLSEELDRPVVIKRTVWDSLIPDLNAGTINMVLAGMTDTAERRESIDFTDPYLVSDLAFLVSETTYNTAIETYGQGSEDAPMTYENLLKLFANKGLVCQANVVGDGYIEDYFKGQNGITHNAPSKTYPLAAQEVKNGTAVAMPAELPVIEAMTNLGGLAVLYVDYSFLSEDDQTGLSVSVGIKKGNDELKDLINAALAKLSVEDRAKMMGAAAERSADVK